MFAAHHLLSACLLVGALLSGCAGGVLRDDIGPVSDLDAEAPALRAAVSASPGDGLATLRLGAALEAAGRHDEAAPHLQQAARALPQSVDALHWLARNASSRGFPAEAAEHLAAAAALEPRYTEAQAELVREVLRAAIDEALEGGADREAAGYAERLTAVGQPTDEDQDRLARVWLAAAERAYAGGYYRDALAACEKAAPYADPRTIAFQKGRIYALLGQPEEADRAFDAWLAGAGPEPAAQAEALRELASFYEANFKFEPAERAYRRSVELDPAQPGLQRDLAVLYLKLRRFGEAKAAFAKHFEAVPAAERLEAREQAAQMYIRFQAQDLATEVLEEAIAKEPDELGPRNLLARLYLRVGKREQVPGLYLDYANRLGTPEAAEKAASALAALGQQKEAIDLYRRVLERPGADPSLRIAVAQLEHELGHDAERDEALDAYVAAAPDRAVALEKVGRVYADIQLRDRALAALQAAVAARPDLQAATFTLAELHRGRDEHQAMEKTLQRFLAAAKDPIGARVAVGSWYVRHNEADLAVPILEAAAEAGPGRDAEAAEALGHLGALYLSGKRRDVDRAAAYYSRMLERAPDKLEAARAIARKIRPQQGMDALQVAVQEEIVRLEPGSAEDLLLLGQAYVAAGRVDQGLLALQRYVAASEDRGAAVEKAALYLIDRGRETEAARFVASLGTDDVKDPQVHRRLALLYTRRGDIARARHHFERFLDAGGGKPDQMRKLGDQLFNAQIWDLAVRAYDLAAASASERGHVIFNLGVALLELRQDERARQVFDGFVEAEPDRARAHERVAQQYYEANELGPALRHFDAAFVAENRRNLDNLFPRFADALAKAGRREDVVDLAQRYVQLMGSRISARQRAAEQLRSLGLRTEAVRVYREILVDRPGDQEAMAHVAEELLAAGDAEAGATELERLVSLRGHTAEATLEAVEILERRGLHDRAGALIGKAIDRGRKDPWLYLERATLRARAGDLAAAHEDVVEALSLSKEPRELLERAYGLYAAAERGDLAIDLTRRAIGLFPGEPEHELKLVSLLLDAGQRDEADQAAFRYLRMDELGAAKLGEIYKLHNELEKAIAHYRKALEQPLVASTDKPLEELGRTLLFSGAGDELDAAVAQYLVSARDMEQAYWDVAVVYAEATRYDEMVRYLIEADRTSPRAEVRRIIALRLLTDGRYEEARRWFDLYMRMPGGATAGAVPAPRGGPDRDAENDPVARILGTATVYRDMGHQAEALAVLDEGIELFGDDPSLVVSLVALLLDLGQAERALAELRGFLDRGGMLDEASARVLGTHVIAAGRSQETIDIVERALEERTIPAASLLLLDLTLRAGDLSAAKREIETLRERVMPGDPAVALRIAASCHDAGHPELAEPLARAAALSGDPRTWAAGVALTTKILLLRGDRAGIEALFGDVLASQDNRLDMLRGLAAAMLDVQQWELAGRALSMWAEIDPTNPEPWRQAVALHLLDGDDEALWRAVDAYVARVPQPDAQLQALADTLSRRLRWDLAAEARRRLMEHDRGNADLAFTTGQSALRAGLDELAGAAFDRYVELAHDATGALRDVAVELLAQGHTEGASRALDRGLEADRTAWRLHQLRGLERLRAGDEAGARAAFEEAARHAPQPELSLMEASYQHLESPHMSAALALELADGALARRADLPGALLVRACALMALGRTADARATMTRYDAMGYMLPTGHLEYAKRALVAGELEEARAHFDRVVAIGDDRQAVLQEIASVIREVNERDDLALTDAQRQGLRDLSLGYVAELLRSDPSAAWFVTLKSDVLETAGDIEGAVAVYREAIRRWPADSALHNNLAYLFARRGENLEEALALVRRARALEPSQNVYYLDTEGWILFQLGRAEEAAELIRGSIRQMDLKQGSSLAESYWHLGQVLERLGSREEALRTYRTAMRMDPTGRYGLRARADHGRLTAED